MSHKDRWQPPVRKPKKRSALEVLACELGGVRLEMVNVVAAIVTVAEALKREGGGGHMNIHVVAVEVANKEEPNMPPIADQMPELQLPSSTVRAHLSVVGAKLPSGGYVSAVQWSSSDETALPLEAIADSFALDADGNPVLDAEGNQIPVFSTYANTPLDEGSGKVTVKASGMADCEQPIKYSDPPVGHFAITAVQAAEA